MTTAADHFFAELERQHGVGSSTARTYRWGADLFLEYLAGRQVPLRAFDAEVWQGFLRWLVVQTKANGTPLAPSTRQAAMKGARQFLGYCVSKRWCRDLAPEAWSALKLAPLTTADLPGRRDLTPTERGMLWNAFAEEPEPYRTVLEIMLSTGVGTQEVCTAPMAGVAFARQGTFLHVRPRTCAWRIEQLPQLSQAQVRTLTPVALNDEAAQSLRRYLQDLKVQVGSADLPWLFPAPTDLNRYVPPDTIRRQFMRVRDRIRLPHVTMRHLGGAA